MDPLTTIFYVVILIMSVVIHEVAHGYAAYRFGDMTARDAGRLTLNPLRHLDLFGSVILPALLILSHTGFVFGWAKPVPIDPRQFTSPRKGILVTAIAGILANVAIAVIFGLAIRILVSVGVGNEALYGIFGLIVFVNLLLALFNLMPVPPLDGSKILFALLGDRFLRIEQKIEQYSMVFFLLFIFFVWHYIAPAIFVVYTLLTGQGM